MRIQQSYLMWVGEVNYGSAAEFVDEVRQLGVSKRLPGIGMAKTLGEPGSLLLVAHDDGEAFSCDVCLGQVECSACRKQLGLIRNWTAQADRVREAYKGEAIPAGKARIIRIREERIAEARQEMQGCELCDGAGAYECGTGGYVVRKDGSRMDYRAYNWMTRQPHKFDADKEFSFKGRGEDKQIDKHMCETCGGTGKMPAAAIFGAFVPQIEVVLRGPEKQNEETEQKIASFGQVSVADAAREPERKGDRATNLHREPGYYATARAGKPGKRASAAAKELVESRVIKGYEVIGDFILFSKPIKASELKRFRGVKRYDIVPEAARMSA